MMMMMMMICDNDKDLYDDYFDQADHRPSPRLFKPEIDTSAACNSIGSSTHTHTHTLKH